MTQITPLQRLIFHLDEAAQAASELQNDTELSVVMVKLYKKLDGYVTDLMELTDLMGYETNLPTDNN